MSKRTAAAIMILAGGLLAWAPAARAQSIEAVRSKVALEGQIEERIRAMASSFLNTTDVAVAAKVNISASRNEGGKEGGVRRWDDKDEIILPGVPAATPMTKDAAAAKAAEAAKKQVRIGYASVNLWVVIGKKITKDQEEKLKNLITSALDLQPDAGDTLSIESSLPRKPLPGMGVMVAAGVSLFALMVLAVFLYGPLRSFLGRLNENLAALAAAKKGPAERKTGGGGGDITLAGDDIPAETTMSGALAISGGGGAASVLTFDSGENVPLEKYVTADNVDDLMLILHD